MNKKYVYRICLNVVYKTQCYQISIRVTVGECLLICELNIITCVCVYITCIWLYMCSHGCLLYHVYLYVYILIMNECCV